MHLSQYTPICADTPVEDCQCVVDFRLSDRTPKRLILGALHSPRLLEWMTLCQVCAAGLATSCKLRGTKLWTILCIGRTKVRYYPRRMVKPRVASFLITDQIQLDKLLVVWCPTGNMIGDYATKPLQGAVFKKFRDYIMGVIPVGTHEPTKSKPVSGKVKRPG